MEKQLRIALAQTCPISASETASVTFDASAPLLGPLASNLAKVAEWIEKASGEGADVVVFPEYFLQGIVDGKEVSQWHSFCPTTDCSSIHFTPVYGTSSPTCHRLSLRIGEEALHLHRRDDSRTADEFSDHLRRTRAYDIPLFASPLQHHARLGGSAIVARLLRGPIPTLFRGLPTFRVRKAKGTGPGLEGSSRAGS